MRKFILLAVLFAWAPPAWADARLPPVDNETFKKECGACHMAFQPQFLPERSWRKVMDTLPNHFGEDATLPDTARQEITDYLTTHAGDVSPLRLGLRYAASIPKDATPIRISEVPRWVRAHSYEVPERAWTDPRVRSKANCTACHRGANAGWYGDD